MRDRSLSKRAFCLLLIFVCFFWTSTGFLSWLYRVMDFLDGRRTDLLCEVAAYLMQAVGIGLFAAAARRRSLRPGWRAFTAVTALDLLCAVPALRAGALWSAALFGLCMNLLHGVIAGFYLCALTQLERERTATVFGLSYGLAVIAAWALSLVGKGNFLRTPQALLVYAAAAALSVWLVFSQDRTEDTEKTELPASAPLSPGFLLLLSAVVLSMSLVKNMGFSFPAADLQTGMSLELTRMFYAFGLGLASLFLDRRRLYGVFACAATLVLPFVMLLLVRETVSSSVLWCIDFFFYGIFSAFRVILFADLAVWSGRLWLSGFGLLFGRVGDALGTAVCIALSRAPVALVLLTGVMFIAAVTLLFALYQRLSLPAQAAPPGEEADPFERLAEQCGLSRREREVLRLLLDKRSNPEIAEAPNVSENTVTFHVRNVLQKTGCKNRKELIEKHGFG